VLKVSVDMSRRGRLGNFWGSVPVFDHIDVIQLFYTGSDYLCCDGEVTAVGLWFKVNLGVVDVS
jgi:hypothetical protein